MASQSSFPFVYPEVDYTDVVVVRHDFEDNITYSLSDFGQKIFLEVLGKLDSRDSHKRQVVTISAAEMEKMGFSFSRGTIYNHFVRACQEVRDMKVWLLSGDSEHEYITDLNVFTGSHKKYKRGDGKGQASKLLEAHFVLNDDIAPYLTQLTAEMRFSQFLIAQTRKMRRASSSRLYQWARRYHWLTISRSQTIKEISVDRLRAKISFSDEKHRQMLWRDFKRRILDSSIDEINDHTDLKLSYTTVRSGRGGRITGLEFTIENNNRFVVIDDSEAKAIEGLLVEQELPVLDSGVATIIRVQFPDITEATLSTLALYPKEIVMESLILYGRVISKKGKDIRDPVAYFLRVVIELQKQKTEFEAKTKADGEAEKSPYDWCDFDDL